MEIYTKTVETLNAFVNEPIRGELTSVPSNLLHHGHDRLRGEFRIVDVDETSRGVEVTARVVVHGLRLDEYNGIVDIIEQTILIVPHEAGKHPYTGEADTRENVRRLDEYIMGWLLAVQTALDMINGESLVTCWPADLCRGAGDVLRLKTATEGYHFRDRFLARSRLGRLVPEGTRCPLCGYTAPRAFNGDLDVCVRCGDHPSYYENEAA